MHLHRICAIYSIHDLRCTEGVACSEPKARGTRTSRGPSLPGSVELAQEFKPMDANRFCFEDFRVFISRRPIDDGEGCSRPESVPIRHCSCKLVNLRRGGSMREE